MDIIRHTFKFLEVDDKFEPNISKRYNVNEGIPLSQILHKFLTVPGLHKSTAWSFMPMGLRWRLKYGLLRLKERNMIKAPKFSVEARKQLINLYREDILKTQDLIQRDLSKWLIN